MEWCKSHARAKRWQEEVLLLQEEMRRVLMFLESEAQTWKVRIQFSKQGIDEPTQEGLSAYAHEQSAVRQELKAYFEDMWKEVEEFVRKKGQVKSKGEGKNPETIAKGERI